MLGQASGGWTESSSALRILHLGVRNTVGVLTDDAFTQTNPPIVTLDTATSTITTTTAQVNTALTGVLSGSVAFVRGDAAGGSNFIGGPVAPAGTALVIEAGCFINSANGNSFENTPGTASGKGPYVSAQGCYGNSLYEDHDLRTGAALTYTAGMFLGASRNGYLVQTGLHNDNYYRAAAATVMALLKMPADATQGELVYDQRI